MPDRSLQRATPSEGGEPVGARGSAEGPIDALVHEDEIRTAVEATGRKLASVRFERVGPSLEMVGPTGGWIVTAVSGEEAYGFTLAEVLADISTWKDREMQRKTAQQIVDEQSGHPLLTAAWIEEVQTACANLWHEYEDCVDEQHEVSPEFLRLVQQVAEFEVYLADPAQWS